MKKRKKGRRFTISAVRQASEPRAIETEPEALAVYVRRAEKEVLPITKDMLVVSPNLRTNLSVRNTTIRWFRSKD
jgi:hypothetical protein